MSRTKTDSTVRVELAQTAARLMAVDGVSDYLSAKKKAASRLGVTEQKHLPSNREIETALIHYQQLFQSDSQPGMVQKKRRLALQAMQFFAGFNPFLVGAVLKGTATEYSTIQLIAYTDNAEQVDYFLDDRGIPYELIDRPAKFKTGIEQIYPCYQFLVNEQAVALTVFPLKKMNQSPLSPTDGKTMPRVKANRLQSMIETEISE